MTKEELLITIKILKEQIKDIQLKIIYFEEELNQFDKHEGKQLEEILDENTESGFYFYLTNIKKLNDHTAHNYFSHLRGIRTKLEKYNDYKLEVEIYNISDKNILIEIEKQMDSCDQLQKDNKTQHNAFTAAFHNYLNYILNYQKKSIEKLPSEFIFDD